MKHENSVMFNALDEELPLKRVIADLGDSTKGNTLLIIGGTHGNELMGVAAIQNVVSKLQENGIKLNGRFLALTGNMEACRLNQRYLYKDLNRMWTRENLDAMHYGKLDMRHTEHREMEELYDVLQDAISNTKDELIVADLHTTSSPTAPFIITNRYGQGKDFADKIDLPVIGGLTGFLEGTLLSYMNELGHIAMAYEAGQHQSPQALACHETFIWLALYHSGIYPDMDPEWLLFHQRSMREISKLPGKHFKIISRYKIDPEEEFRMEPGYSNFQRIEKGEILASNREGAIHSFYDGFIFMPLYQERGDDGFFIIQEEGNDSDQ